MSPDRVEFIFDVVSKQLPAAGVEFIMIGGHAVNHYGFSRATIDIDFMIASDDIPAVRSIMKAAGFTNISESENVVFFEHPDNPYRVDFLRVDAVSMGKLLARAVKIEYAGVPMAVPSLKDLISMKLFALKSGSPRREEKDLPDIVNLALEHGLDIEADLKPLCDLFANDRIFDMVSRHIKEADDG